MTEYRQNMQVQALTPRILGLVLVSVVACSAPKPNFQTAWQSLLGHLSKCTVEHGYDPRTSDELGKHELGKNEGQWRACAYAGIEAYMIPATVAPDLFRKLVRLDRKLTGQVARGDLSRSARKSRIKEILGQIRNKEEAYQQAQFERLREIQDVMERQRRSEEMQRIHRQGSMIRRAVTARF